MASTFSSDDVVKVGRVVDLRLHEREYELFVIVRQHKLLKGMVVPFDIVDLIDAEVY